MRLDVSALVTTAALLTARRPNVAAPRLSCCAAADAIAIDANFDSWLSWRTAAASQPPEEVVADALLQPERVGRFIGRCSESLPSTSQAMKAVRSGRVLINGTACHHASMVNPCDIVTLLPPPMMSLGETAAAAAAAAAAEQHDGVAAKTEDDSSPPRPLSQGERLRAFASGLARSGQAWVVHEEDELAIVHKPAGVHTKPYLGQISLG